MLDTPSTSHPSPRSLLAAWLIVRNIAGWLTRWVMLTPQELREAGVYLGE